MTDDAQQHGGAGAGGADASPIGDVARRLTGELRCIGCGYDLRGLSIRAACPECGLPVRATLLGVVDPHAEELEPLTSARLVANGLVLWTGGALAACLSVWAMRLDEIARAVIDAGIGSHWMRVAGFSALCASALGSLVLIRPHARTPRRLAFRAAVGVAAYAPVLLIYWTVYLGLDARGASPLIDPGDQRLDRSLLRIAMTLGIAVIIFGLRPAAVALAGRSVLVRTGRVDRQSMYALLASFLLAGVGDAINVFGAILGGVAGDLLAELHVVFVAIGSVLITLGLANMFLDTLRLRPLLRSRGVGLSDIFETNRERESRIDAGGEGGGSGHAARNRASDPR